MRNDWNNDEAQSAAFVLILCVVGFLVLYCLAVGFGY